MNLAYKYIVSYNDVADLFSFDTLDLAASRARELMNASPLEFEFEYANHGVMKWQGGGTATVTISQIKSSVEKEGEQ